MGKVAKILPDDKKEIAISNGLSLQTVYRRIKAGWDVDKAISTKPKQTSMQKLARLPTGEVRPSSTPKGRTRGIRIDAGIDEAVDEAIAASGLSQSDWFNHAAKEYLKLCQRKNAKDTKSLSRRKSKQGGSG